jgi:glycosyltransferase involved in cell wall biosynthesis
LVRELAMLEDVHLRVLARRGSTISDAVVLRRRSDLARRMLEMPRLLRGPGDVFVTTTDRLLAPRHLPTVLIAIEHPQYRTRMHALTEGADHRARLADRLTRRWFDRSVRRADRIVATSTSTARDLVFLAGVDPARVSVALPGPLLDVSTDRRPVAGRILAFTDRDPRDNGLRLLDAFARLPATWTLDLVGDADDAVRSAAATGVGADRITVHGRVGDDDVRRLLETAALYLDVSLYEGFGAQVAEATAAGVPVVASWVTSLPEVAGRSATFVNPHDPDDIAAGIQAAGDRPPPVPVANRWAAFAAHVLAAARAVAR